MLTPEQKAEPLLDVTLPIELTNGNDGRGSKWFRTASVRKKIEATVRLLHSQRVPFAECVTLSLTRILGRGQRLWDSDSILRGNSKELIDALVVCGWFHDDSPKWIAETHACQDATQRENGPAVRVQVFRKR